MTLLLGIVQAGFMVVSFFIGCEVGSRAVAKQFCRKCQDHCL